MASEEFPSNSRSRPARASEPRPEKAEAPAEPEQRVKRVTTKKVVRRRKTVGQKFRETFFTGADSKSVLERAFFESFVPGAKDAIVDGVTTMIERAVHGEDSRPASRRRRSSSRSSRDDEYTEYRGMSRSRGRSRDDDRDDPRTRRPRTSSSVSDVVVSSKVEAQETLEDMYECLSKYDVVTVRDFLNLVGEPTNPTDNEWGWYDLAGSRIHRVREGYLLDIPRPVPLD